MSPRLLAVALRAQTDVVLARKRTRRLAELLGFDRQDQTRITTAVSEIARNAFEHGGGGTIAFHVEGKTPQRFEIVVQDKGKGIANLQAVMDGSHRSAAGMGIGLRGARRLMEDFRIESGPAGTTIRMGRPLPARATPVGPAELQRLVAALAADGPVDVMDEISRQNQEILLQMEALRERGEHLERLNEELADTNRGVVALYAELEERADHLRRADELKSKFLSHMSHEFRTPLNSILALSRLLLSRIDGPLSAEQETQVQFVRRAAESLTELVDDLLDLAKVEAGKTVISPAIFNVEVLFGALRGMLRPLLVSDRVALNFEVAPGIPEMETDEGKLSQILRNFISNALKFTERGEVRVSAAYDAASDSVVFAVRDTGVGIAAADIELIFQEFTQVENPLQGSVKGTGLGLPLARKLAELLGGRIAVESRLGEGSVFTLRLPRRFLAAATPVTTDWTLDPDHTPVLLVEDDPADALVLHRWFADSPYQLLVARSIAEAQHALAAFTPAAVLLDLVVLGDESWRLLLELRSNARLGNTPIIVTSATGDEVKARHLGADEYLSKPLDRGTVLHLLDRMTGRSGAVRVLMIDDEEVARYLVRQLLPRSRFNLHEAPNGEAGLEAMRSLRPALVLLDLNMPGLSGHDILAAMQADAELAPIPAIVLTSAVLTPSQRARLGAARAILSKARLSSEMLLAAIAATLSDATARPPARAGG